MTRVFVCIAICTAVCTDARAYDPPTHAGLTERAALASSLHKRLMERLGRPLGLYEPLRLDLNDGDLRQRLSRLDPEGGFAPDERGAASALAWLTAGAVLEGVPAHRTRNHFFDPTNGAGLSDDDGSPLRTRFADVSNGIGTVRGIFTGANFDGTGVASPAWLAGPRSLNDWGLGRFLDERERAAAAPLAAEREDALARALLAAGAILHVLEDAGDPAFVRNDFRIELEQNGAPYDRFVERRYGRLAVPEPGGAPIARAHLEEYFRDHQGGGLAERTARRFFTDGTLPGTGRYSLPVASAGRAAHGWAQSDDLRHLLAWRRYGDEIVWTLDDRCRLDYAEALLPEIGRYAAGALELLFRGRLDLAEKDGALHVAVGELALGAGRVTIFADTPDGARKPILSRAVSGAAPGEELGFASRPAGTAHATALFRGVDTAGEPIVIVQDLPLK
jgi:hypothetical protein